VLEHLYAQSSVERRTGERERLEVGHCIEGGVIPALVSDGEIHPDIAGAAESLSETPFAGASVEHPGARPNPSGGSVHELPQRIRVDFYASPEGLWNVGW
jgi:hypothetical protein